MKMKQEKSVHFCKVILVRSQGAPRFKTHDIAKARFSIIFYLLLTTWISRFKNYLYLMNLKSRETLVCLRAQAGKYQIRTRT
jgi:hypothetical protein